MIMKKLILLASLMAMGMFSMPAQAVYTTVYNPPGSEAYMTDILDHIYGGSFITHHLQGASVYTNASGVIATRVSDDGLGGLLNLISGTPTSADDKIWTDGIASLTVEARFAAYSQQFGYDTGSGYTKVFDVIGSGFSVTGSGTVTFTPGSTWNWVRSGTGGTWYSDPSKNDDRIDHMVTYQITGLGDGLTTWLVFWEDIKGGYMVYGSDRDFNDMVVEIKAAPIIPSPGAILLGGIGVCLVGWMRRRKTV
jgi:hypothetical protein